MKKRNILSPVQSHRLIDELLRMKDEIAEKRMSATEASELLTRRCGFLVTKGNLWSPAEELGVKFQRAINRELKMAKMPSVEAGSPDVERAVGKLTIAQEQAAREISSLSHWCETIAERLNGVETSRRVLGNRLDSLDSLDSLPNCVADLVRRLENAERELFSLYQHLKAMSLDLGRPLPVDTRTAGG